MIDLTDKSLAEIAAAFRSGTLSARVVTECAIANHARWDQTFNAYKAWADDTARAEADAADRAFQQDDDLGRLQGIPVSVKDIYGVNGFQVFAGSPKSLPPKYAEEGPLIAGLRAQKAIIPGKTHTVEFAYGGIGANDHWGTPRNPWDTQNHRVPGGSSAGAGVSLIEGSALLAFGTDTGGSVRIPASFTGTVGLKTSIGRWSTAGIVPLSQSFDTAGILCRSVADTAYAFAALDPYCNVPPQASNLKDITIATTDDFFWDDIDDSIAATVTRTIDEIIRAGASRSHLDFPLAQQAMNSFASGAVAATEAYANLAENLPEWLETLQHNIAIRIADGKNGLASDYVAAQWRLQKLARAADDLLRSIDILAVPTIPISPPTMQEIATPEDYRGRNLLTLRNTMPGNHLALSALTLPAGLDANGMPVGLQLIARAGSEEHLLSCALAIENLIGKPLDRIGKAPLGGTPV